MYARHSLCILALAQLFASASWAADGAAVYRESCAKCHGDTGKSDTSVGKALNIPPLAGDASLVKLSEAEVMERIKAASKHPPTTKALSDDDLKAVATFALGLASSAN